MYGKTLNADTSYNTHKDTWSLLCTMQFHLQPDSKCGQAVKIDVVFSWVKASLSRLIYGQDQLSEGVADTSTGGQEVRAKTWAWSSS